MIGYMRVDIFVLVATLWTTVAQGQIGIGTRVLVSHGEEELNHLEVTSAADPDNPESLVACSMVMPVDKLGTWTAAYVSFDGGKTFSRTVEQKSIADGHLAISADPTCAYGIDGSAYFAALSNSGFDARTLFFKSPDGGRTWLPPVSLFGAWDRPFIAVDRTKGKNRGRIYVSHNYRVQNFDPSQPQQFNTASGLGLQRSLDGGRTFIGPSVRLGLSDVHHEGINPGNTVVLSDGTTVTLFFEGDAIPRRGSHVPDMDGSLKIISSTDGGESLGDAIKIADHFEDRNRSTKSTTPNIAVDPGSEAFKDRLYVVWHNSGPQREEGFLSYSSDRGKAWSSPIRIGSTEADVFQTTVGVNKEGVVGLMWYEDVSNSGGYRVRFTASIDGGQSWLTPVTLSEYTSIKDQPQRWILKGVASGKDPFTVRVFRSVWQSAGDTAGLSADSNGLFHAFWIDNRSGVGQVWTAPLTVSAPVSVNGSRELDRLDDVSKLTAIEVSSLSFDSATQVLREKIRIKNISSRGFAEELKLRIFNLESELSSPILLSTEDEQGSIVDFFEGVGNKKLGPGEFSAEREIAIKLSDLHVASAVPPDALVKFDARVFTRMRD